jgi:hypothetical protein
MKNLLSLILLLSFATGCMNQREKEIRERLATLKSNASAIDNDFRKIRTEVEGLALSITRLYERQNEILPGINKQRYQLASNGVFFKPVDDGGSAVFVSGYYPVNEQIRKIVYFTEPIDSALQRIVKKYPEVVQVYYNDQYSYNRIYPFFDVLSQYEAKMNIPGYNFYYLADHKHNPEKKSLWVSEAYVDPAGRGWMVSAIAPVYHGDSLVGVPGIDVTINEITKRYLPERVESLAMIIDNTGMIVTAQEATINMFSFPPLFDHKYIETIKQDTYRKEMYNLSLSKEISVRKIAEDILKNHMEEVTTEINGEKISVLACHIPELNWYLLEIIK